MGPRVRGPHRFAVGDDRGPQEDPLRGRPVRVRRAAGRGVPARPAALPLPLVLLRPAQPEPLRGWQGQSHTHVLIKHLYELIYTHLLVYIVNKLQVKMKIRSTLQFDFHQLVYR